MVIEYDNGTATGEIDLGNEWRIEIADNVIEELKNIVGSKNIAVKYFNVNRYIQENGDSAPLGQVMHGTTADLAVFIDEVHVGIELSF